VGIAELSTWRTASRLSAGCHPSMFSSSVAKMKTSPVKSVAVPLKTIPVGAAVAVLLVAGGIVTTNGTFFVTFTIFPLPS
jgi:hypothetical protein